MFEFLAPDGGLLRTTPQNQELVPRWLRHAERYGNPPQPRSNLAAFTGSVPRVRGGTIGD